MEVVNESWELLSVSDDRRLIDDSVPSCWRPSHLPPPLSPPPPPHSYFNSFPQVTAGRMGANYLKCLRALCQPGADAAIGPLTAAAAANNRCCLPITAALGPDWLGPDLHLPVNLQTDSVARSSSSSSYSSSSSSSLLLLQSVADPAVTS